MKTFVLALPGAENLGQDLAWRLGCEASAIEMRRFADGEELVRLRTDVAGCRVVLAAQLDHPDEKTLPLLFAADAARELGAAGVGLVAPYLPYMRQDTRFRSGEAVSARSYARLLSGLVDFLVTVGPHLHRFRSLDEIYTIPTALVSPAPPIAAWLAREVPDRILVGVGSETAPWVQEIATLAQASCVFLERRPGSAHEFSLPAGTRHDGRTPVLLQDIATTGDTLIGAAQVLRAAGWPAPVAVVIHALLQQEDVEALHHAGLPRLACCSTVPHRAAVIPVGEELAAAVRRVIA